jgi:hypothetical protein
LFSEKEEETKLLLLSESISACRLVGEKAKENGDEEEEGAPAGDEEKKDVNEEG